MAADPTGASAVPYTREWPRRLRVLAKLCLTVIYGGVAFAAGYVALPMAGPGVWWMILVGGLAAVSAAAALILMLIERWMEERGAANFAGLMLAVFAGVNTIRLALDVGADPAGTALIYVAAASVGLRSVYLAAFDGNLNGAKRSAATRREAQA